MADEELDREERQIDSPLEDENSNEKAPSDQESDLEILARAKKNFKIAQEAWSEIFKEAIEDFKFRKGDQWPEEIKIARDQDDRPCLTINRIPQYVNQVVNDIRQNRPSIDVNPTGGGAKEETAEVFEGLIRNIQYVSNADIAYDTAVDHSVTGGFGFWRVTTEYENENSFNIEPRIKRIRNPFSVLLDPSSTEPDGSDSNWGHVFDDLDKSEFKARYPNSKLSRMSDWDSIGNNSEGWVKENGCRVSEYMEKIWIPQKLYLLSNGDTVSEDNLDQIEDPNLFATDQNGERITRDTLKTKVMWYLINGLDILERREFPCRYIPIVPDYGTELIIEGERILQGIVRQSRDPQRMLNFWTSAETEVIALAPKAPFIGAAGQFENFEKQWQTSNNRTHPYLEYNPVSSDGKPLGPPTRNTYEPPVQAITQARMAASEDLKTTMGMYDASLGNRSNEVTGRAIERRNAQAQTANFHFSDNTKRSIRHTGRILVDMIPRVYDTARAIRIIDEENQQKIVWVNQLFKDGHEDKIHRLAVGNYDVVCDEGPDYQTKRQESVAAQLDLLRAIPDQGKLFTDLMVRNMDWPGKDEIADRIRRSLPPQIVGDDNGQQPIPPQAQQQIAQLRQMVQMLTQKVQQQNQQIATKKLELESKERMKYEELLADMRIEAMRTDRTVAQDVFLAEIDLLQQKLSSLPPEPGIDQIQTPVGQTAAQPGSVPNQQTPTGGITPG